MVIENIHNKIVENPTNWYEHVTASEMRYFFNYASERQIKTVKGIIDKSEIA
jgi:CRISPR/Cas system CSM-associated protein Csm2 small subunit